MSCQNTLGHLLCLGTPERSCLSSLGGAITHLSITLLSVLYSYQIFGVFESVRSNRFTESSILGTVTHELVGVFYCLLNFDKTLLLYI